MLDIFRNDAFSVVSLTDAINQLKYVPGRVGKMGLFSESGITTATASIENRNGVLVLVAPTPRGAPGQTMPKGQRGLTPVNVPHFEINDAIMAEEVQGVRAFGEETALETVQGKVAERSAEHSQSMDATSEYSRVGALKGVITYADGSTLDTFSLFGVSQIPEVAFDLSNANPTDGALRKRAAAITRTIAGELDGVPFSGKSYALVGDNFFDDLLGSKEVRDTYKGWTEAQILRDGYVDPSGDSYGAFEFGNIIWENYRGAVGGQQFVDADACHIFPMGAPGLFRTYHAPADYIETVNTRGKRLYAKQYDMPNGKGVHFDVQMNELNLCTRPRVLIKGRRGA